ncbi:MAG: YraN family protein [bacterium]
MYKNKVGRFGEELAKKYLIKKGYFIIGQNIKLSYKELDIVARHENKIIFIEVKTKISNKFGTADENMNSRKLHHLKKAIGMYVENKRLDPDNIRLDLISIDIDRIKKIAKIKHYKDIF